MSARMKLLRRSTVSNHEGAYFEARDQESVAPEPSAAPRSRHHLRLLQGGRPEDVPKLPVGTGTGFTKKAA